MSRGNDRTRPAPKRYRDINVFFTWADGQPGQENELPEPIMFLGNPRTKKAFGIPLGAAWKYADSATGDPTGALIQSAAAIAQMLGMGDDRFTVGRVCDAIVECLPDLIEMGPAPERYHAQPEWDGEISINGGPKMGVSF